MSSQPFSDRIVRGPPSSLGCSCFFLLFDGCAAGPMLLLLCVTEWSLGSSRCCRLFVLQCEQHAVESTPQRVPHKAFESDLIFYSFLFLHLFFCLFPHFLTSMYFLFDLDCMRCEKHVPASDKGASTSNDQHLYVHIYMMCSHIYCISDYFTLNIISSHFHLDVRLEETRCSTLHQSL